MTLRARSTLRLLGVILLAATVVAIALLASVPTYIFTPATKVCQLTGVYDKELKKATPNAALMHGLTGSDVGYPVQWGDKVYFLFGDSRLIDADDPDRAHLRAQQAWDAVATAPAKINVAVAGCITPMEFIVNSDPQPGPAPYEKVGDFRVVRLLQPAVPSDFQPTGFFQTPVSGVTRGNEFFVFFSLARPKGDRGCTQTDGCALEDYEDREDGHLILEGGITKLAKAYGDVNLLKFTATTEVSVGEFQWVAPVAFDGGRIHGMPKEAYGENLHGDVVLIWGTGRTKDHKFREGYPRLAVVPLSKLEWMNAWRYFVKMDANGPVFMPGQQNAAPVLPFGKEGNDHPGEPGYHQCVGEFSVSWVSQMAKFVMVYACGAGSPADPFAKHFNSSNREGVYMRTADAPWGPWSPPQLVFDPLKSGFCHFMYRAGCSTKSEGDGERVERSKSKDDAAKDWPVLDDPAGPPCTQNNTSNCKLMGGGEYDTFLVPSYTKVVGNDVHLYLLMSTWNPYQVVVLTTVAQPQWSFYVTDVWTALRNRFDTLFTRRGGG